MELSTPAKRRSFKYGTATVSYDLRFAVRKTLGISVMPDLSVIVTAPEGKSLEDIESKVRKRAGWILKQQNYFRDFLPIPKPPRYLSGETHRFLGKQFRLRIARGKSESVKLKGGFIEVTVEDLESREQVKRLVNQWFRSRAKYHFDESLRRCLDSLGTRLTLAPEFAIRQMKNRWGSLGENGVIYLHPELVRTPRACIDYVVTHELCHLLIPDHSPKFFALIGKVMPDWEQWKRRLELCTRG